MYTIINGVLLFLFTLISYLIFTHSFIIVRTVRTHRQIQEKHKINQVMYYLVFIVCTAPFFLGVLSIAKYAIFFTTLLILIAKGKVRCKTNSIVYSYYIFLLWLTISISWSDSYYDGILLIIKYSIPLLSLWLGYSALQAKCDLYYFSKKVTYIALIYALFLGGVSAISVPSLYHFWGHFFLTYAGLADYFTSIIGLFFILNWITKETKYYLGASWLLLSTIIEVVRTGLGGITIVGSIFSLFRYRLRALPAIAAFVSMFLGIILFVPQVNEKFFGSHSREVTASDIIYRNAMSSDNISTNGRDYLWKHFLAKFYASSPLIGSGLGTATHYLKDKKRGYTESQIVLLHSDYVQLLCDSGLISVVLLGFFYLTVFLKGLIAAWKRNHYYSKVTAALAVSSMAGVAFSMGYDNVVSHSMTSLINPFIFIGFFIKCSELKI